MADDEQAQQQQDAATANTPEDVFKRWVKEYRILDKEIKESGATLSEMRKRKKQLNESILTWMQGNRVLNVHLRDDDYLARKIKTSQSPLNADIIGTVLQGFLGNEEQASEATALIYEGRPEVEQEVLVVENNSKKKRQRLRPVELEDQAQ
jgi:molybdopterin converting factor small subunit